MTRTQRFLFSLRPFALLIQDEQYLLACMRYIELNPVRANMVKTPSHYPWSSYGSNAQGKLDSLITPHALYLGLGKSECARLDVDIQGIV